MEPAIAKLDIALRAAEPLILPPYKGSTLRGGFGAIFRRLVSVKRAAPHPFEIEPPNGKPDISRPAPMGFPWSSGEPPSAESRIRGQGEITF
jgi:hypothetical protein